MRCIWGHGFAPDLAALGVQAGCSTHGLRASAWALLQETFTIAVSLEIVELFQFVALRGPGVPSPSWICTHSVMDQQQLTQTLLWPPGQRMLG